MGLSVPQVSKVFHQLRAAGYPVSENVYTVDQAEADILRLLKVKGGAGRA